MADRTTTPEAGRERALLLADIISDTPARDTVVLDIHELSPFADYFVITAGANERQLRAINRAVAERMAEAGIRPQRIDRKSTRLNSSHANISYAVFCLKKKKKHTIKLQ